MSVVSRVEASLTAPNIFAATEYPNSVIAFKSALAVDDADIHKFNKSRLINFIRGSGAKLGAKNMTVAERKHLLNEVSRFYAEEQHPDAGAYLRYLKQYTNVNACARSFRLLQQSFSLQLVSDLGFIVPILNEARDRARRGSPVYVFQFDHVSTEMKKKLPYRGLSKKHR